MVPDAQQPDEPKDHEFGSYCFEELEPAKVLKEVSTGMIGSQGLTTKNVECLLKLQKSFEVEDVVLTYEETPWGKGQLQVVGRRI